MKSRSLPLNLFGLFCAILLFCGRAYAENIVDYYNRLPGKYLDGQSYTLVQKDGQWTVSTMPDYGQLDAPVVDIKNGYVKTVYHGGDGDQERVIALFLKADNTPVIGIAGYYNGLGGDFYVCFCEFKNNTWKDVTGTVLPETGYRAFLGEAFDAAPFERLLSRVNTADVKFIRPQVKYTLPRAGTTVTAAFHLKEMMGAELSSDDKKVIAGVKAAVTYRVIELNWDARKGVFTIGKKK